VLENYKTPQFHFVSRKVVKHKELYSNSIMQREITKGFGFSWFSPFFFPGKIPSIELKNNNDNLYGTNERLRKSVYRVTAKVKNPGNEVGEPSVINAR